MAITLNGTTKIVAANLSSDLPFPSGTRLVFAQTSAPTGWTKDTTHNDKALRVVSGTAGSGGSVAFSTAFASGLNAGATTLSTSQIPSHGHEVTINSFAGDLGFTAGNGGGDGSWYGFNDAPDGNNHQGNPYGGTSGAYARATGGGGSHNHSLPSFAVQYVDVIVATKD